uniref:Uncharacterized protein n=1 Tax=Amphimedon queenslandica TaxID=400682 RepID=A0A1X7SYW9_AMPQE
RHPSAIMKLVNFDFDSNSSYIKLSATFHEKSEPQLLSKETIDNYNEVWHDPPFCQISLSPDAAQSTVQCSLSLKNATEPILNCKAPQTLDKNSYIGLIYYEWEKKEFLMTFLAGKKLAKIAQYIEKYCPLAEINQLFYFSFSSSHDFIELKFDCSQDESCKGWTVQPLVEPCRLYQNDIDEFSKTVSPVPPCCSVSVRGSPDAIPTLHYSIPLVGVANPVTLCIDRKLQLEKDILELFASHDTEISLEAFIENRRKVRSFFQGLAHQNKVLLNQALVEADKQAADDKFAMSKKLEDVSKKKESITEDNEKLQAQVADIEKEMEKIEEEKRKVEEDYFKIIKDLRAKVSDNELYTAKLMKEREQLQERVTSLEKQSIKETTCSSQFNYMIPSMDKLKCLSDALQVAERQLFLIEGDKPQLMNLKKYGLRIGVQEESLLSSETGEVAVVALAAAKGQFQFPANTVLVSDVYAVSLSKPLLKQLKLEIQYSIDLTGQPDFTQYLKFAIAPVSTPSLPYQFSIVEGGEFSSCSGYRFIQVNEPCLVCTLQDKSTNGGASVNGDTEEREEEKKEQQPHEKEEKQLLQGSDSFLLQHEEEGIQQQQVEELEDIEHGDVHQEVEGDQPHQEKENEAEEKDNKDQEGEQDDEEGNIKGGDDDDDKVQSTHARKVVTYAGLVYYEEKGVEDLVTFAVAKDLNTLYDFLKRSHEDAICGPNVYFQFDDGMDYIELCLNTPQKETPTGWTIQPHVKPCRLYRQDIYKFHEATCPVPPSCLVSVHASPGADPTLHYSVPLKGVADPVTLFIHASRKQRSPPTLTGPTTSSSNTIFEAIAVSSTGVASPSATVDVNKVKKVVHDVIVDTLKSLEVEAIPDLTDQLDKFNLINSAVRENPSMDKFVSEFKDILSCLKRLPQVQEHCQKFLSS